MEQGLIERVLQKYDSVATKYFPSKNFCESGRIFHFSYHKCLTVYYQNIMRPLGRRFHFEYKHFNSRKKDFIDEVLTLNKLGIYSVNNVNFDFDKFPDFRGSHFVRDPRDLVVSGYRYHLWTKEKWCRDDAFDWSAIIHDPMFSIHIESDKEKVPSGISYQNYLNTLSEEKGMVLEMIWRKEHFKNMLKWDYDNPKIMELRYEDLVGNEEECFRALFDHYGMRSDLKKVAVKLVDEFSLKNKKRSEKSHTRHGGARQWESEFSESTLEIFNHLYSDLVDKLGYDK